MKWEREFENYLTLHGHKTDAAHDLAHFRRVYKTGLKIAEEGADVEVLIAAAYFHDLVSLPKNHPERHLSSLLAAQAAEKILTAMGFPTEKLKPVFHAIHAHSFSAKVEPQTVEAKIVQDADRIEALGALGILRCLYTGGKLKRTPYHPTDLFGKKRPLNDELYTIDHFFIKLFKLKDLFQTKKGRALAALRTEFLQEFVEKLAADEAGAHRILRVITDGHQKSFFHSLDPFAKNRKLENEYIVDELLADNKDLFISKFLAQLKDEIL